MWSTQAVLQQSWEILLDKLCGDDDTATFRNCLQRVHRNTYALEGHAFNSSKPACESIGDFLQQCLGLVISIEKAALRKPVVPLLLTGFGQLVWPKA